MLANKLKATQSTVARWETGERLPPMDEIMRLANILDCAPAWLAAMYGDSPGDPKLYESAIPVFSDYSEIDQYLAIGPANVTKLNLIENYRFIFQDYGSESHSRFAIIIPDNGMSPKYNQGDVAVIDTSIEPAIGNTALVYIDKSQSLLLRKYKITSAPFEELTYELISENPDWPTITVNDTSICKVLGVMIECRSRSYP